MNQTFTRKGRMSQFLMILVPILITQLAMFSMTFFDTMMSGQFHYIDLAGVAIGSSLWVPVYTGLSGILFAITPIISQSIGAKDQQNVSFSVFQGIYTGFILSILVYGLGFIGLDPFLQALDVSDETRYISKNYLLALSLGIFPLFLYTVLRSFIDALGLTRVSMFITLIALPLNIAFNFIFIFGPFGLPAFGGIGAGIATSLTYWFILIITIFIIKNGERFRPYRIFTGFPPPSFVKIKEILIIGIPIGLSIFFETSIFSAVTLLMDDFGDTVIAAHQAALNFASFLYMIPLSVSFALTIVVGFEVGANRIQDARSYARMGIVTAVLFAFISGIILYIGKDSISLLYSRNTEVVALTSQFLLYAVFFQLSDAIQAPVQGALRGYKDVNVTFIMTLISYWVIGLPLGYVLSSQTSLGPFGYWIGLIAGLTAGAITLSTRLHIIQRKRLSLIIEKKGVPNE
ncbi:multidrug transporter MatE [Bacillus coahuilensis p1.1.43]|uniref:Probable multidrug resistance protein NorM n=1 Tax=Bacillus coahuilensis p1.1.43 TaxID=1150625 RepID=A0A147K8C9_9BACI|nr:MATE family efflux transporter [Bacillus coahuilensis]KUP06466.1 multidrug transporter MatE [Bacillus coahuilensis p1.1.43]